MEIFLSFEYFRLDIHSWFCLSNKYVGLYALPMEANDDSFENIITTWKDDKELADVNTKTLSQSCKFEVMTWLCNNKIIVSSF